MKDIFESWRDYLNPSSIEIAPSKITAPFPELPRTPHVVNDLLARGELIGYMIQMLNDKSEYWYDLEWVLHRTGGPAVTNSHGQTYFEHGKKHRIGGPAVIPTSGLIHTDKGIKRMGKEQYWLNGTKYDKEEYDRKLNQSMGDY